MKWCSSWLKTVMLSSWIRISEYWLLRGREKEKQYLYDAWRYLWIASPYKRNGLDLGRHARGESLLCALLCFLITTRLTRYPPPAFEHF